MTADRAQRRWRKSSYSANTTNCVEIAEVTLDVLVRDSKLATSSPVLCFERAAWRSFLARNHA